MFGLGSTNNKVLEKYVEMDFYDLLGTLTSGFYYVIPLIVVTFNYFDYIYSGELIEAILVFVTTVTVISSFVKLKYIYNMLIIKRNIEI